MFDRGTMKYGVLFLLAGTIWLFACEHGVKESRSSAKSNTESEMTMAKDSELALLMRELTAETESIRAAVMNGEDHPLWKRTRDLHIATPTDKASSGPVFEGFAAAFVGAVEEMQIADSAGTHYFNAVIDRCIDCHQTFCPGPVKRIRKFYVPVNEGL